MPNTGPCNGLVCLFDASSGGWLGEFVAHGVELTAVSFTADICLLTSSIDGSIGV